MINALDRHRGRSWLAGSTEWSGHHRNKVSIYFSAMAAVPSGTKGSAVNPFDLILRQGFVAQYILRSHCQSYSRRRGRYDCGATVLVANFGSWADELT
ncbi:hypothetical protein NXC14_PA00156 (plasmid) [Rhizobium sp. NXC14]|nr:hypothetical protein NXC14_PA00156 [Rhizobium sp. NXC14]